MIYFTLPNLYNHKNLMMALFSLNKEVDKLKMPMQFVSTYDPIPYCYLAGGVNVNQGHILKYHQLEDKAREHTGLAKRLDFSNLNIEEADVKDEYFNIVLNMYNTGSNWIEVSNLNFATSLKKNYPMYDIIFSHAADIMFPFNAENLNVIIEQDLFKLISLPAYYSTNLDFLRAIDHRSKLELTVNNICANCSINCQKDCIVAEHSNIYNYSNVSGFKTCANFCSYLNKNASLITLQDIKTTYLPMGITHYRLNNFPDIKNAYIDFVFFVADYFIKDEYKEEIIMRLLKEIDND